MRSPRSETHDCSSLQLLQSEELRWLGAEQLHPTIYCKLCFLSELILKCRHHESAQNAIYLLDIGDKVAVDIPAEEGFGSLQAVEKDLEIVYEDEHFLILNKPAGVASIPSVNHSNTMANFVKAYYIANHYENQQIHIVTRLDRDTSGLMLFAKHGYAHARLDKQLQKKVIEKHYYALVKGSAPLKPEGDIIAPIAREGSSIITRCVAKNGKYAHTSYKVLAQYDDIYLVDIHLHTGRTHQIRVHFSYIGFPLL